MPSLREFLEKINIKGQVSYNEPMSRHTSFHIGGPADVLVVPENRGDFIRLVLAARAEGIPLFVLGGGANLLVGDRGIRGIVLSSSGLREIELAAVRSSPGGAPLAAASVYASEGGAAGNPPRSPVTLAGGAGLPVNRLCEAALTGGLAGLGTFFGMPGSLGGAVYMNARCYEAEIADRLAWVDYLPPPNREAGAGSLPDAAAAGTAASANGTTDRSAASPDKAVARLLFDPAAWSYKRSPFQRGEPLAGAIILGAGFALPGGNPAEIRRLMEEKRADRAAKGHYRLPCAGSVFKNNHDFGAPTGKLLDSLGFRGRRIGDAMVSDWHANIFVNAGHAKAADMRALIETAQSEAKAKLGFDLEPEVLFVGEF